MRYELTKMDPTESCTRRKYKCKCILTFCGKIFHPRSSCPGLRRNVASILADETRHADLKGVQQYRVQKSRKIIKFSKISCK